MLAVRGAMDGRAAGWVGQITANSFMKREFGKKLIQEFFPTVDLTYVIDTSGVRLAGFGTPPVTLIGRRRWPRQASTIRTVLGVRAEPGKVQDPANGFVWRAIVEQVDHPGSESQWVSVLDLPRDRLAKHPWSLGGGGAQDLLETINRAGGRLLKSVVDSVGITCFTLEDDLYFIPNRAARRHGIESVWLRPIVEGEAVRDWFVEESGDVIFPYDSDFNPVNVEGHFQLFKYMWPCRTNISNSILFGRKTKIDGGLKWSEFGRLTTSKLREPRSIAFAEIATHNHFALDQDGKIFNRSAPVIKLPESATDEDHFALLGMLNSSAACFYFRQVCQPKGGSGIGRGVQDEPWEERFVFNATRVGEFPLPSQSPVGGERLDGLATHLHATFPAKICRSGVPTRGDLDAGRAEHDHIRGQLIALQEELDWRVYRMYGFLDAFSSEELIADLSDLPDLKMGERAFEICWAVRSWPERQIRSGSLDMGLTPITEIPAHWPGHYRTVVAKRIEAIRDSADIALIERPECKRRWQPEPWEEKERLALTSWLLDRCEDRALWYVIDEWGREQPRPMTVNRLADRLRTERRLGVGGPAAGRSRRRPRRRAGRRSPMTSMCLTWRSFRYKATGMRKRAQWEETWDKQREEDATGKRLDIAVPPKYKQEDFDCQGSTGANAGKLDVPKERFISYPHGQPGRRRLAAARLGGLGSPGAGARADDAHRGPRHAGTAGACDKLTPLIAGLAEVMPWVRQWHGEIDPRIRDEARPRRTTPTLRTRESGTAFPRSDLRNWSPPVPSRRRRRGSAQAKGSAADDGQQHDPGGQDEGTA